MAAENETIKLQLTSLEGIVETGESSVGSFVSQI